MSDASSPCPECKGTGTLSAPVKGPPDALFSNWECSACSGVGRLTPERLERYLARRTQRKGPLARPENS